MDWSQYSDRELLGLYASLMESLRTRGIVRSSNNPIADFSESLVARALTLTLDGRSTAGYDATDPASGLHYQIKGRRLTKHNSSTQLSALRGLDRAPFDILAAVMFDADFGILYGALIPLEVVRELSRPHAHTNSHRFLFRKSVLQHPEVTDITDKLRAAVA